MVGDMAENDTRRWHPSTLAAAGVILLVAGPIVALLVLRIFVFQLFNMPSGSMIPNVIVGDYFIAKQSSYDNTAPARGDIVVLNHAGVPYVKRVVGLPGDRIQMDRGNVVINGSPVRLKPAGSYSYTDESG